MSRVAREGDKKEVRDLFGDVRKGIAYWFRRSTYRRAAFVDGDLAAIWGCDATLASAVGNVWMMTAPPIEKIPITFFRVMRQELDVMSWGGRELHSASGADYPQALRSMKILGFEIGVPRAVGAGVYCDLIYRGK